MKLSVAATYFHKTVFKDAYRPVMTFKGKLTAYDDATRDSLSTERRILAVGPSVNIPARRTIKTGNQTWLVGDLAVDFHGEDALRNKYILHQATELAQVRTFAEAIAGTGTKDVWASRLWVKETKESDESSGMYGAYSLYFSHTEDIRDPLWTNGTMDGRENNVLVKIAGRWHLVRATMSSAGGFLVAVADELPEPCVGSVSYQQNAYNPLTDSKAPTITTRTAVFLRWQSFFTYMARYSEKFLKGDAVAVLLQEPGFSPKAGDTLTIAGQTYKVEAVQDYNPCWSLHIRHV